jgi:capsular exopolysaccharide synthesis family protein
VFVIPHYIWVFARRWLWLLALATLLGAGASYLVSSRLPKVYDGTAKLLVTPSQSGGVASYNDVLTGQSLTRTYAEVIKTRPIVEAAAKRVGIDLPYQTLVATLDVKPIVNTQLIQISAKANDPEVAADFANQVANTFIQSIQTSQSSRFSTVRDALARQVSQLANDVADRTRRINELQADPSRTSNDPELTRLRSELTQLQSSYDATERSFEDARLSEARSIDALTLVEPAAPSVNPVEPRVLLNVLAAGLVALLLALGAAYGVERVDDRLRSPERVTRYTSLHVLGSVARLQHKTPRTVDDVHIGEALRLLRINLQFAAVERPLGTLLITSSEAGDGKTTIATNLAIVLAQAGQQVILVDADLRRPTVHQVIDIPNRSGLTSLLINDELDATSVLAKTRFEGLSVIPSGPQPPNPSELLASERMRRRLAQLREMADVVILDSPPVLAVSDPAILAALTDGALLVVNSARTRGAHAAQAVATLQNAGAHLLGIVLNRTALDRRSYYGYYAQPRESREAAAATQTPPASQGKSSVVGT